MNETPQQAAQRLSASAIKGGFKPEALHEYKDSDGNILCHRIRLKHPNGEKWIRPMYLNGNGYEMASRCINYLNLSHVPLIPCGSSRANGTSII
jgi:hypothetical protein